MTLRLFFLGGAEDDVAGRAVFAAMEGSRPVLTEVQGLAGPAALGSPRRSVVGWDNSRLAMLLAVFETRCGLVFGNRDVYLSVAGGYRINEPAGDLAAAAALATSAFDAPAPSEAVFFGEVSLSGAIRPVGRMEPRLKEAARLGFRHAFAPQGAPTEVDGMTVHGLSSLHDLTKALHKETSA
ncbi:MAG: magnesium chelatase domain-containing protein [Pseudomonadota bacterium]